jgi:DNA-directed RNA polymerase sigma subunit (sigma70/sigma32)
MMSPFHDAISTTYWHDQPGATTLRCEAQSDLVLGIYYSASTRSFPLNLCRHQTLAPESNLSRYLQEVRKFLMLTAEEESARPKQWRDQQDVDAAHKLVTSHLRLVAKIAMGYLDYGLPVGQPEGNIGMMQAVRRFDPDRGFRLAIYAMWWIRAAIQEYILRSWSLVKIGTTTAQKTLFFNLWRLKGRMQAIDDGDLKPEQSPASRGRSVFPRRISSA